jgi:hypothetical protein
VRRLPRPAPKTRWLDALTPADRAEAEAIFAEAGALAPELTPPPADTPPCQLGMETMRALLQHPRGPALLLRLSDVYSRSFGPPAAAPGVAEAEPGPAKKPPEDDAIPGIPEVAEAEAEPGAGSAARSPGHAAEPPLPLAPEPEPAPVVRLLSLETWNRINRDWTSDRPTGKGDPYAP